MCGENNEDSEQRAKLEGSSPRVRGKLVRTPGLAEGEGLIPACAGKTAIYSATAEMVEAHPRVCGENACRGSKT